MVIAREWISLSDACAKLFELNTYPLPLVNDHIVSALLSGGITLRVVLLGGPMTPLRLAPGTELCDINVYKNTLSYRAAGSWKTGHIVEADWSELQRYFVEEGTIDVADDAIEASSETQQRKPGRPSNYSKFKARYEKGVSPPPTQIAHEFSVDPKTASRWRQKLAKGTKRTK
jgi:hypothetical protein